MADIEQPETGHADEARVAAMRHDVTASCNASWASVANENRSKKDVQTP